MCNNFKYPIANFSDVKKRVNQLEFRSSEIQSRMAPALKNLWNPERVLQTVSERVVLSSLKQSFPQFEEVIDFYENSILALAKLNLPFETPPILLQGDPGLGKTYFASELAKCLTLPFYEISLATTTSTFGLSGANLQWAEATTGFVANTLANSEIANPMILIDELDKSLVHAQYNPMNVFYSLLESHSASRFKDEALEFELDASKIIWVATANYSNLIPSPIQSRMRVFEITQPSPEKMLLVIESIYQNIIQNKTYGKLLDQSLGGSISEILAFQSPRTIKLAIEEAAFTAIRNHRRSILTCDLPTFDKERNRVGFI